MTRGSNEDVLAVIDSAVYSRRGWWRVNCPFCLLNTGKDDKRRSLGIRADDGKWHCFRCDEWGYLEGELPEWIGAGAAPKTERNEDEEPEEITFDPPEHFYPLWREPAISALTFKPARDYLRSRGLKRDAWHYAGIGACAEGDYAFRIIVPVFNVEGTAWIGYVGRYWTPKVPSGRLKYRYPPGMQRTQLYDEHLLFEETEEPVLIVEGVMDALPYFGRACACLGKPTREHKATLRKAQRPIAICLDGDAHEEAWGLAMQLRLDGLRAGFVKLPPGLDPATVDRAWLLEEAERCINN